MSKQYPTGIPGIDQVLCDGVPAGQLVVIETDSDSPGEALLRRLTLQQPTLFVSTMRIEEEIEEWLEGREQLNWVTSNSATRAFEGSVPPIQIEYTGLEDALATTTEQLSQRTESVNVIIDSIDSLERKSETEYLAFLQRLKEYVRETEQIAYLHVLNTTGSGAKPANRALTHKIADIVWQFTTNVVDDQLVHQLAITKDRTGLCSDEPFSLSIDEEITVDSSRNISL